MARGIRDHRSGLFRAAGFLLVAVIAGGMIVFASCSLTGKENALDTILLGGVSDEAGLISFDHRLHWSLCNGSGERIACARCHHRYGGRPEKPPRPCSGCHISHDDGVTDLPYL